MIRSGLTMGLFVGVMGMMLSSSLLGGDPSVELSEFIFEKAPFRSCHASTIAELPDRSLVAAWFGGDDEGEDNVGIWVSRRLEEGWTPPREVANGVQYSRLDGSAHRYPCWNPVLYQPSAGPLLLFYKVGPNPREWWGMLTRSRDGGQSWDIPARLPEGILGPVRNKPIEKPQGRLLCGSSTEHDGWKVHLEVTDDWGVNWLRIGPLNDVSSVQAIQPSLLTHRDGRLQMLSRDRRVDGAVWQTWSSDGGRSWTEMEALPLPNPNSGLDAVTLSDGQHVLVYNHTLRRSGNPRDREALNVALSDDGLHWKAVLLLENEKEQEFSYPAVIQSRDGMVHVVYTWKRERIKHVVLDPDRFEPVEISGGNWPWSEKGTVPEGSR